MNVSINTAVFLEAMQNGVAQSDCVQVLAGMAIDAIEVRGEFFKPETKAQELAAIAEFCQAQNFDFYYSVPEELFTATGLNPSLTENLAMAQKYQIKGLKYSFGTLPTLNQTELETLKKISTTNVAVTIENQPNQNGVLATFVKDLTWVQENKLPLGYTFDSGNWYWIDEKPETAFAALKDQVTIFHLKDIKDQDTVLLGEGLTDWQSLVQQLKPTSPVFLEYAIQPAALNDQIQLVNKLLN
ncbi:sugar phosphate isomerase/epimerase family protein [Agrilactobacillus yilanensis]|uniref:Sugar phosphate isomerase/epimerase family protein n=1 Tax=Agrilactobacillus yilanensis TaxID=2485997 RepID=A0ABW4J8D4_9LACO|nr:sugar phosphate isomerase/epimerase [Agrilactobacillus yilanensis]